MFSLLWGFYNYHSPVFLYDSREAGYWRSCRTQLGFSQFLFQFSDAVLVFGERTCLMAAADESVITVTDSGLAPFGKRVVLETELICCSFYSDFIGEL